VPGVSFFPLPKHVLGTQGPISQCADHASCHPDFWGRRDSGIDLFLCSVLPIYARVERRPRVPLAWLGNVPLPVAGEVHRLAAALYCPRGYAAHLIAIRDGAVSRAAP
jgi:hypothetical protein